MAIVTLQRTQVQASFTKGVQEGPLFSQNLGLAPVFLCTVTRVYQ